MKNFLLAVALLSIGTAGTAVAAGSDNLTKRAAELQIPGQINQMMKKRCFTGLSTSIEEQRERPLSASEVLSIGEICECTGKKSESLIKRIGVKKFATMDVDLLYGGFLAECVDAWLQKHK
ncbi:hypothetical protein [Neisseria polysaccharea]|uniref:hypothetical protein n=1 Tax=Neisseria polysaccharea TaxID=489 RepID=UPI0027DECDE8|nr:hypothetical protein [Neisseria polysaccharea]